MERVSSGLSWLDEEIEKGLPKNKVTLLVGQSGTGKTNFGLQFLKSGLYSDEKVAIFTAKESPTQIKENISNLGWNLEWAFEQDRFKIVDIRNYFEKAREEDIEMGFLNNFFLEIQNIVQAFNLKRLVFDPVIPQSVNISKKFYDRYLSELTSFLEGRNLQATSLLVSAEAMDSQSLQESTATNVIRMFFAKSNSVYKRTMFVQKMQNTYYEPKEIFFDIVYDKGLVRT